MKDHIFLFSSVGRAAVSYTHLDVYKRQVAAIAVLAAFVYLLARPNKYNADYRRKALTLPVKERA